MLISPLFHISSKGIFMVFIALEYFNPFKSKEDKLTVNGVARCPSLVTLDE